MFLKLLIVGGLLTNMCLAESNLWRRLYVNESIWTTESIIAASSEMNCAMKASQLQWPFLIMYTDDGSCSLSSMKIPPIKNVTVIPNYLARMTKVLADDYLQDQPACPAPFTMVSGGNGCYKYVDTLVRFNIARDECIAMGADLASPGLAKDKSLYGIVYEQLGIPDSANVWIGGKRDSSTPFVQISTPGTPAFPAEFWAPGKPGSVNWYVGINGVSKLLFDYNSSESHPFIYEIHSFKF